MFIFGRAYLVVDEKPERADAVIALSWDVGRLEKATELYHAVYTKEKMLGVSSDYQMREVELVFDQV